jgi:dihydrofolate reductase
MKKSIIVSYSEERGIGADGDLLWQRDLPADLRRFQALTTGNAIIMGRITFFFDIKERILPNRQTIIVTRQDLNIDGATIVGSIDDAFKAVEPGRDAFVIGGEQMFRQTIDMVDRIYATEVHAKVPADTFFPEFSMDEWREVSREQHKADDRNKYDYDFVLYERR